MREINHPLLKQIQMKKEEMFACARETGYNSTETIVCSQELDKLIYEYQISAQKHHQETPNERIQFRQLFWFFQPKKTAGEL